MSNKNHNDYSWILRGKQRQKIIKVMDKPKIPTQIKEETNLSLNNVPRGGQLKLYFFILLGAVIFVGLLVLIQIILTRRRGS